MLNKNAIAKIIAKYALILIVLYLIQYIFNLLLDTYLELQNVEFKSRMWLMYIPLGVTILLNLMTAIIVFTDIKRLHLKSRYITFMTLICSPLGICLFFITLINQSRDENA